MIFHTEALNELLVSLNEQICGSHLSGQNAVGGRWSTIIATLIKQPDLIPSCWMLMLTANQKLQLPSLLSDSN